MRTSCSPLRRSPLRRRDADPPGAAPLGLGTKLALLLTLIGALASVDAVRSSPVAAPLSYSYDLTSHNVPALFSRSSAGTTGETGNGLLPATLVETSRPSIVLVVAAEGGSEVLLDTSAVKAQGAAQALMKPGECAVICSTVEREAAEHGFSTAGLPVIEDGTSAVLRSQVAQQLRGFGAAAQGLEGDATIGATALERGIPLITGDRALWNAVLKLGGDARWFAPGL